MGLIGWLNQMPLAGLMLVVALGFTLGRVTVRGVSLGPAGGTLAVAIVLGRLGLDLTTMYGSAHPTLTLGALGFALFIYSVGFEAGPRFFGTLAGTAGWRILFLCLLANLLAVLLALACGGLLGLGDSITAGLLAGALTSPPTYAAAAEVCTDRTALALSFALTYPLGLISLVLAVIFLPRLMRDDLQADLPEESLDAAAPRDREVTRCFEVTRDDVFGHSLAELGFPTRTGCYVTTILRDGATLFPSAPATLEPGDHVVAKGRVDELREFRRLVGPEVEMHRVVPHLPRPRRIRVLARAGVGQCLSQLTLLREHRCLVTAIDRAGFLHEPSADFVVQRADVLLVVGPRAGVRAVAQTLGRYESDTGEVDIAVYAGGIFLGLCLSTLHLGILNLDLRVGVAGGLLLTGVLLGRFRRLGPLSTHVPRPARQLVRDLGILLFIAETGVSAGGSDLQVMGGMVLPTLGAALLVAVAPVVAAIYLGRRFLRMRTVDAWGTVGGAMTSSAALVAIRRAADSNEPALSYAAAYALASVVITLAGQLVVLLMQHA